MKLEAHTLLSSLSTRLERSLLIFLSLIVLSGAAYAQIQFPVTAPTPKVGEIAKYRTIDLWNNNELSTSENELMSVEADGFVTRFKNTITPEPRTDRFNRSWQSCRSMQGSDKVVCGGSLNFPMQIGNKHSYDKLPWTSGLGHDSADCEVKGEEKVTVPAGTYDTLRITCSGFYNRVIEGKWSGRFNATLWYAPSIGRPVKNDFFNFRESGTAFTKNQSVLTEFIGVK